SIILVDHGMVTFPGAIIDISPRLAMQDPHRPMTARPTGRRAATGEWVALARGSRDPTPPAFPTRPVSPPLGPGFRGAEPAETGTHTSPLDPGPLSRRPAAPLARHRSPLLPSEYRKDLHAPVLLHSAYLLRLRARPLATGARTGSGRSHPFRRVLPGQLPGHSGGHPSADRRPRRRARQPAGNL